MQPDNTMNTLPNGEVDREGAMAKADLYKLANYSLKLFKKVQDEDQMEAWVQAKITKAADYIASVYHYLEYEMKISEYGTHLETAEMYSEGQKTAIKNKLMEAKEKVKQLKKLQADKQSGKEKKVEEGRLTGGEETCTECGGSGMIYREAMPVPDHVKSKVEKYKRLTKATHAAAKRLDKNKNGIPDDEEMEEGFGDAGDKEMKVGDTKKTRTGELTKTSTGVVHKNTSYKDEGDEIASNAKSGKGIKSHAKAQSAAEKKEKAPAQKMSPKSAKTWGMKDSEKFDNRDGAPAKPKKEKEVDETYGQGIYAEGSEPKDKPKKGEKVGKEGNAFGKAVRDAKASGDKTMTVGGKTMSVKEALKGGQKKLDVDGDGDIEADDLADLRAKKEKKVDEAGKTMSRAAKGHEKYGKEGMAALAKAGKEGKSLEPIKAKYNKYDESTAWKNKVKSVKESLDSMTPAAGGSQEDLTKAAMGLATYAAKVDPKGFEDAMEAGDESFAKYLQDMLVKGNVQPDPKAVQQAMDKVQGGEQDIDVATSPEDSSVDATSGEETATSYNTESINESSDFDRMKQFLTRLNG